MEKNTRNKEHGYQKTNSMNREWKFEVQVINIDHINIS